MGMVVMSKRELNRLDVLARLDSGRLTARAAAELMAITPRQTYRLLRRYRDGGASAVANQRRGRPSNNRCDQLAPCKHSLSPAPTCREGADSDLLRPGIPM
jgi:transposase